MRIWLTFITGALVISMCLISPVSHSGAIRHSETQTELKAAAQKAWPAFFAEFRMAVRDRNREALRKLMVEDFNGPPHTREEAFRQWNNPKVGGWMKFRRVLAQGATLSVEEGESDPEQARPTMISPPAAEKGHYRGWFAAFEFQEDGKWRCLQFISMSQFSR